MKPKFYSGTVSFLVKRLLIFASCYIVICAVFFHKTPHVVLGAVTGVLFGTARFVLSTRYYGNMLAPGGKKRGGAVFGIAQVLTAVLLVSAAAWRIDFFLAAGLGLLMIPFVIFVNGITEALGLTKNKFGG